MLKKWQIEIGSIKLLNKLETITCQWEVTKLTIFATRILTPTHTITYRKGSFSMLKSFNDMAEFAKLLLAFISLRRLVYKNHKKVNVILKEKQQEEVSLFEYDDHDHFSTKPDSTQDNGVIEREDINYRMDPDLESELVSMIEGVESCNVGDLISNVG